MKSVNASILTFAEKERTSENQKNRRKYSNCFTFIKIIADLEHSGANKDNKDFPKE